jgi:hypothetical protein
MRKDQAVRWVPTDDLPELPLAALDLSYDASQNLLTAHVYFRDLSAAGLPQFEPHIRGLTIAFNNVEAFKAYEEYADPIYAAGDDVPLLTESVPYGGTWGFIQMHRSSWLERLSIRNGSWSAETASHWVVKTGDMVLHVATRLGTAPDFQGWLEKSEQE